MRPRGSQTWDKVKIRIGSDPTGHPVVQGQDESRAHPGPRERGRRSIQRIISALQDPYLIASTVGHALLTGIIITPMIALTAVFLMETIWSPGPHVPTHVRDQVQPTHTDQSWDISVYFKVYPKDRTGLLDAIERSAHDRGGMTLARTSHTVTVLTDRHNGETLLSTARAAETTPLGEQYLG